jgi:hypothetical protein
VAGGLSYREARALAMEEALCLLHHLALRRRLDWLEAEAARVAGLALADPHEQQLALSRLEHAAAAELKRFHTPA